MITCFVCNLALVAGPLNGSADDLMQSTFPRYLAMQGMVEDDLWWKATFGGRRPLMEDNL